MKTFAPLISLAVITLSACASSPGKDAAKIVDKTEQVAVKTATQRAPATSVERVSDTQNLGDAMLTPLSDVNLKKQVIPARLEAMTNPYSADGTGSCESVIMEITELNELLGLDFDQPGFDEANMETKALNVTSSVVGGLVPFRGIIRTATGASKYDRTVQRAYRRGVTRRAYLKGIAAEKGCN